MSRELVLNGYGKSATLRNEPKRSEAYREFRRRVLHLSSLNLSRELFVGPITYEETIPFGLRHGLSTEEMVESLDKILLPTEKGYQWVQGPKGEMTLSRRVTGRIAITNYDPSKLTNQERRQLALEAENNPRNAILVDIRPDQPGGAYPMHGMFIIRSFHAILQFLANGIAADPEYHVEKDVRTGEIPRNPPWTIAIDESAGRRMRPSP
jgi:hypothetical protein